MPRVCCTCSVVDGELQWCRYCRNQMQLKVDNVLKEPMCCSYERKCAQCRKIKHKDEFRRIAPPLGSRGTLLTTCTDCRRRESTRKKRKREEQRIAERLYYVEQQQARERKRKRKEERKQKRKEERKHGRIKRLALEREQLERDADARDVEAKKKAEAEGLVWTAPPPRRYKTCKECNHKRPEYEFYSTRSKDNLVARCIGCRDYNDRRRLERVGRVEKRTKEEHENARLESQHEAQHKADGLRAQYEAARIERERLEAERMKEEREEREAARWIKARTTSSQKMRALRAEIKREKEREAARWIEARRRR